MAHGTVVLRDHAGHIKSGRPELAGPPAEVISSRRRCESARFGLPRVTLLGRAEPRSDLNVSLAAPNAPPRAVIQRTQPAARPTRRLVAPAGLALDVVNDPPALLWPHDKSLSVGFPGVVEHDSEATAML